MRRHSDEPPLNAEGQALQYSLLVLSGAFPYLVVANRPRRHDLVQYFRVPSSLLILSTVNDKQREGGRETLVPGFHFVSRQYQYRTIPILPARVEDPARTNAHTQTSNRSQFQVKSVGGFFYSSPSRLRTKKKKFFSNDRFPPVRPPTQETGTEEETLRDTYDKPSPPTVVRNSLFFANRREAQRSERGLDPSARGTQNTKHQTHPPEARPPIAMAANNDSPDNNSDSRDSTDEYRTFDGGDPTENTFTSIGVDGPHLPIAPKKNGGMGASQAFSVDGDEWDGDDGDGGDDPQSSGTGDGEGESSSGGGSGNGKNVNQWEDTVKQVQELARSETKYVNMWRRNVFLLILIACCVVSSLTYVFLHREDVESFVLSYNQFALTIQDSTAFNLKGVVEATAGIGQVYASEAYKTNASWPFMTLSSFEVFVGHSRAQSSSELLVICPFVESHQLEEWATYSHDHSDWIDDSFEALGKQRTDKNPIPSSVYRFGRYKGRTVLLAEDGSSPYPAAPFWQMSPPPYDTSIVNYNALSLPAYQEGYDAMVVNGHAVMGRAGPNELIEYAISQEAHDALHTDTTSMHNIQHPVGYANQHPHTPLIYPVYVYDPKVGVNNDALNHETQYGKENGLASAASEKGIVAMVVSVLAWDRYLQNLLPDNVNDIVVVLRNDCGQEFTYLINGHDAVFLGNGDRHDPKYDEYEFPIVFYDLLGMNHTRADNNTYAHGDCSYSFFVYPSDEFFEQYDTAVPLIFALLVAAVFVLMAITFAIYDWFVIRKNNKIVDAAVQSNALVSSLFPKNVRDRLLAEQKEKLAQQKMFKGSSHHSGKDNLKSFLEDGDDTNFEDDEILTSKPIADLFPETTIMFCDLVGFTAWSSMREPTAVFVLLETLYRAFDKIAKRRRIFKVETIGDCYVAVAGLPEPRKDHAIAMCRFSYECMGKMQDLTRKLEVTLGPDTGDLSMRFGLHSGPVTAGVLRGDKGRFQLFGDTMNTAARMESNGKPGRIHLSQETADLIVVAGKEKWVTPREDKIVAKGKGEMQTYWLTLSDSKGLTAASSHGSSNDTENNDNDLAGSSASKRILDRKTERLVRWHVDLAMTYLKRIVASRGEASNLARKKKSVADELLSPEDIAPNTIPLEEVREIVSLPDYNAELTIASDADASTLQLDPAVESQLHDFISTVASMYHKLPFHNFEHASHVTMSVAKLLSRITAPSLSDVLGASQDTESSLHAYTYGITSDPLTQFACVFSALIHDLDHPGVPNGQLMVENPTLADYYQNKSIAEQNSLDLAWNLLHDERFSTLRSTIYSTQKEKKRFRELVVNVVLATDVMDKELKELRNKRWDKAFSEASGMSFESPKDKSDRKATIVIEHLIQASDVAHTMQHWHIYRKWNTNLFREVYKAYQEGRAASDPAENWYKGEIGFFDFYIIPLARKLKQCGVFGVSSDEYLNYAMKNRQEWEAKGQSIVAQMAEELQMESRSASTCAETSASSQGSDTTIKSQTTGLENPSQTLRLEPGQLEL